jgi:hypothetical protein
LRSSLSCSRGDNNHSFSNTMRQVQVFLQHNMSEDLYRNDKNTYNSNNILQYPCATGQCFLSTIQQMCLPFASQQKIWLSWLCVRQSWRCRSGPGEVGVGVRLTGRGESRGRGSGRGEVRVAVQQVGWGRSEGWGSGLGFGVGARVRVGVRLRECQGRSSAARVSGSEFGCASVRVGVRLRECQSGSRFVSMGDAASMHPAQWTFSCTCGESTFTRS